MRLTVKNVGELLRPIMLPLSTVVLLLSIVVDSNVMLLLDAYFAVVFIMLPIQGLVEFLCFLFPLMYLVEYSHVLLMALIALVIKRGTIDVRSAFLIVFFAGWEFIAHFMYGASTFNRMMGYVVTVAILVYLMYETLPTIDYAKCIEFYIWGVGVLFAAYLLDIVLLKGGGYLTRLITGQSRFGATASNELMGLKIGINANTLAYCSVCGISSILFLQQYGIKRIFHSVLIVFFGLCGIMTLSRTWILVMLMIILLYALSAEKNVRKIMVRWVGIVVIGGIVIWYLSTQTSLMYTIMKRFESEGIETAGGRTVTIAQYLSEFFANDRFMLLGTGVTDSSKVIVNQLSIHNGTIQILVSLGIPAAMVMYMVLCTPLLHAFAQKISMIHFLPILTILAFTQTIQFLNPNVLMLHYVIGVYALRLGNKKF